jgi:hypothetical protein
MFSDANPVFPFNLKRKEELRRLEARGENNSIGVDLATRLRPHPSSRDAFDGIRMDKLHILPMQAGEIIRIHNTTLTSEFDLGNQGLIVLFRCRSLEIRRLNLHLLLAYLLARAAIECDKVALKVEENG